MSARYIGKGGWYSTRPPKASRGIQIKNPKKTNLKERESPSDLGKTINNVEKVSLFFFFFAVFKKGAHFISLSRARALSLWSVSLSVRTTYIDSLSLTVSIACNGDLSAHLSLSLLIMPASFRSAAFLLKQHNASMGEKQNAQVVSFYICGVGCWLVVT